MRLIRIFGALAVALFITITVNCFGSDPGPAESTSSIGGTGSEVVGVVNYPDSSQGVKKRTFGVALLPMKGAKVFIHPRNFLPNINQAEDIAYGYTNSDGTFRISKVVPGEHMVYINDGSGMAVATLINVPSAIGTIDCGTLLSQKTASVQTQYQGTMPGSVLFYISLRGTGLLVRCTERNLNTVLSNIPTGPGVAYTLTVRMYEPFRKSREFSIPALNPGELFPMQPFTDF